ncbi:hypothetical protein PV11_05046 [Exophiala sideris]|uniref:Homeobox domain-containing protein n=1 Tax=Exophiala sideris TaxID=1016849 RepID=A0A0D1YP59_9EURO|nr:hypothetical protein PV11_05046 [Exophiala sideris]
MEYMQESFSFPAQHQPQMYYQAIPYPAYVVHPQQQQLDDFYARYAANEYADFMPPGMMHDEFGPEMEEISTRPRLTKEQVEILEAQFQANHKPNSQVKRQLAIQTNLKFQRVGNWFQNRRAKAKQQKRQEEYEAQKSGDKPESRERQSVSTPRENASPTRSISLSPRKESVSTARSTPSPVKTTDKNKEASWASLRRALGQGKAAQVQQIPQPQPTMAPPGLPAQPMSIQLPLRPISHHLSASAPSAPPAWTAAGAPYPSPGILDQAFDFGFDDKDVAIDTSDHDELAMDPLSDFIHDSFVVNPTDLDASLETPKGFAHQHNDSAAGLPSPGLTMPEYPDSRRHSSAVTEELSNNFGNFALASSSPTHVGGRRPSEPVRCPPSGSLDIAARRKRPRPAALTSTALRSRSYGAMTSVSPTFRPSITTPAVPHTIRHVKSAGHSLNSRYAGVRKASSAQRSPMCVSTFAENEAFNQLMAQQAINVQQLMDFPAPMLSPDIISSNHMTDPEKNPFFNQGADMSASFSLQGGQTLSINTSPPITPLPSDFMVRGASQQSHAPPASAPPQYASFPEFTPPYSAGPMTNSSWSDALTSPEVPSFPPVSYVPSLGYQRHADTLSGHLQQFVLPSDTTTELDFESQLDRKKTEFYIQEFPNQKEEHANIAQQLAQQKPKNYVFANTAPQDYTAE